MRLTLMRQPSEAGATIGKLFINGAFVCWTLEDEIREVEGQPVSEWKIKGATAIPAGQYRITLEPSARFGPDTLTISNVPGFQFIRMHAGNTAADTEGCPLLGLFASAGRLMQSRPAVELVRSRVRAAIDAGEEVEIDINNPEAMA